jgi:hypothetical protein
VIFAERDPALRQFERDAVAACAVMAAVALVVRGGRPDVAAGVLAGALLMAASYLAIKGIAGLLVRSGAPGRRALVAVKFLGRYALLAVGAYVMLVRFRLHPVGLLAGASVPFVSAVVQVVRAQRASSRRGRP